MTDEILKKIDKQIDQIKIFVPEHDSICLKNAEALRVAVESLRGIENNLMNNRDRHYLYEIEANDALKEIAKILGVKGNE